MLFSFLVCIFLLVYVQLFIFYIILSKSRSLKFQILIRLVDFSNDSCYTKVEEPFFRKTPEFQGKITIFSLNLLRNSLIFATKAQNVSHKH